MGKRYALCVGVNKYKNAKHLDLRFAANDALMIGQILEDKLRGSFDDVSILIDEHATKISIIDSF